MTSDNYTAVRTSAKLSPGGIPLALKLAYTAFMALLVPVYWHYYGPTNFLYFCDIALFFALVAVWTESPLLTSSALVGVMVTQAVWVADFLGNLVGVPLIGITDYMFEAHRSLLLRGLSSFHGWLPFMLAFMVWRVGYDRRGFPLWTALTWLVLPISYFLLPPPHPDPGLTPVNVNYVWGFSDRAPQQWLPPDLWFAGMMVFMPLLLYWPAHALLAGLAPRSE